MTDPVEGVAADQSGLEGFGRVRAERAHLAAQGHGEPPVDRASGRGEPLGKALPEDRDVGARTFRLGPIGPSGSNGAPSRRGSK